MVLQITSLSLNSLLDGLTATLIVIFTLIFAIVVYAKAIKLNAKLLKNGALMGGCAGMLWLGPCSDFLLKVFFDGNLNPIQLYGILSYMWVAPTLIFGINIGAELMMPSKRKIIIIFYSILGIIFESFLFFDTANAFIFTKDELIAASFVYGHPTFILIAFFLGSILILNGIGSLIYSFKSTGVIKRRFRLMSLTFVLFVIVGVFDALLAPGPILFIARMGMVLCAVFLYAALKP